MVETSKPVMQSVGNYDLIERIAEGGMGTVYKGRHRETGQIVAIKIVPPHMSNNAVMLKRFEQEFRAASRLDHANIVRALDYGDADNTPYLVMEFVDGESLGAKLEREGKMGESDAIKLIAQVAQGLHRAHKQGLVHRDVKPDNVLISSDGVAKLADLGLVKEVEADLNLTRTGRGLGTPHFMAPEQFRNAKNADIRCDIYSLGATLYMTVTGELPFKSSGPLDAWMKKINNELTPPRTLVPELSERVDWAIRRAMSPDAEKRPSSCREFVEDLTGHSTRKVILPDVGLAAQDQWYLVYKDEEGIRHIVKGTTQGIRRSLKEGLLGDASNVRASRLKTGPFEAMRGYPEFRDLVIEPAPVAPTKVPTPAKPAPTPVLPRPSKIVSRANTPTKAGISARTPPPVETPEAPLIDLGREEAKASHDWIKWVLLLIIAVATAIVGFFVFPHL